MNIYTRLTVVLVVLVSFISGCATGPKLTEEQILSQYDRIAALSKGLKDAAASGVDDLAPGGFKSAQGYLDEAIANARGDRKDAASQAAARGVQRLDQATKDAAVSRDLLREVLDARSRAYRAGSQTIYPERTQRLDEDLRKTANLVEQGRIEDVKRRRPKLITEYEQLELASLKEGMVEAAQATLEEARRNGAPKYAPKTFKMAEDELNLALSVLDADRSKTDKANTHAARAKWLAERSSAVTELIKDFDRRDYTREDVVLWYQEQLREINQPLDRDLPFNEPNRTVVLGMQQAIGDVIRQRDATAAARTQYEQELSATSQRQREEQERFETVQALFDPAEANVYRQRQNVLISAHGFRFPSGGSEIEAENFPLLNKIVQAIAVFPDSRIRVSGHTDSTGSAEVNQSLSEQRAAKVSKFLVEVGGVSPSRISWYGYGKERPVASNETAEGRAANRRVEILIQNP